MQHSTLQEVEEVEYLKAGCHYIVRLDKGDEVVDSISRLCEKENIKAGTVTGLGAANDIELGIFDTANKQYLKKEYTGDFEISALVGNISRMADKPYLHLHITVGNPVEERFAAGHLSRCVISATGEIYITEVDAEIGRLYSEEIGLNLIEC